MDFRVGLEIQNFAFNSEKLCMNKGMKHKVCFVNE